MNMSRVTTSMINTASTDVDGRRRASTSVDGRRRAQNRAPFDFERVYVRRRT